MFLLFRHKDFEKQEVHGLTDGAEHSHEKQTSHSGDQLWVRLCYVCVTQTFQKYRSSEASSFYFAVFWRRLRLKYGSEFQLSFPDLYICVLNSFEHGTFGDRPHNSLAEQKYQNRYY